MAAAVSAARFACAACAKKQPAAKMTYSRHTHNHYCLDFAACDKRRARLGRAATTKGSRPRSEGATAYAFVDVVAAPPNRGGKTC